MLQTLDRMLGLLRRRRFGEHGIALWRVVLLGAWLAFLGRFEGDSAPHVDEAILATQIALAIALILYGLGLARPKPSPAHRVCTVLLDQGFLAWSLMCLPVIGEVVLVPLMLLVSVVNSLAYGRNYGLLAALLGIGGFLANVLPRVSGDWNALDESARSTLVSMIVVAGYVALASGRILGVSESYRVRARRMARIAMEDPLTKLANRTYFERRLRRAIELAQPGADPEEGFALLYCDLDDFKSVNDTHGHQLGDAVLREVAAAMRKSVRGSDVVSRLGGDEFAVYLKGLQDEKIARRVASSIVAAVANITSVDDIPVTLGCSVGISMFAAPVAGDVNVERALDFADGAMFQAKRRGKGRFHVQWAER